MEMYHSEQREHMLIRSANNPCGSCLRSLLLSRFCGAVVEYLE